MTKQYATQHDAHVSSYRSRHARELAAAYTEPLPDKVTYHVAVIWNPSKNREPTGYSFPSEKEADSFRYAVTEMICRCDPHGVDAAAPILVSQDAKWAIRCAATRDLWFWDNRIKQWVTEEDDTFERYTYAETLDTPLPVSGVWHYLGR